MAKKSVIAGEYTIEIDDKGHVDVLRVPSNSYRTMLQIAKEKGFQVDEKWNTQDLGRKLVTDFGDGKTAQFGDVTINRLPDQRIKIIEDYKNIKAVLREIAEKMNFPYDKAWNTQTFGSKLFDFLTEHKAEADITLKTPNRARKSSTATHKNNRPKTTEPATIKNEEVAVNIRKVMALLAQSITANPGEIDLEGIPYNNQRSVISKLFSGDEENQGKLQRQRQCQCQSQQEHILLRLVVLNSYYSTNAAYSYFSLEELAQRIIDETTAFAQLPKAQKLSDNFFYHILLDNINNPGKNVNVGNALFKAPYGIKKDGTPGYLLSSLISKYAYYCLLMDTTSYPLGFPIYDSLARESYGKVMIALGEKPNAAQSLVIQKNSGSIGAYIVALNKLREAIFGTGSTALFHGLQQFDILDAYLWWMGKLEGGNLSLLLTKSEYQMLIGYVKPTPPIKVGNRWTNTLNEQIATTLRNSGAAPFVALADPQRKKFLTAMIDHWRYKL